MFRLSESGRNLFALDYFLGKHFELYQGDIVLDPELKRLISHFSSGNSSRVKRNAIREKKRLWTSRVIPYLVPSYMSKTIVEMKHCFDTRNRFRTWLSTF